jgi:arylsulfatase B
MTGRHPQTFGHEYNPVGHAADVGLALGEKTIADRLGAVGYDTALIGKCHLGFGKPFHPRTRGFGFF